MDMFMVYAKHEQEKEDLINSIIEQARMGNTSFSFEISDDFSEQEFQEIQKEVMRRL